MRYVLEKRFNIDIWALMACVIILCATALRVTLIALGWPPLDSDEGTMGIMAMHIAFKGQWPIFFYGQGYMGTFEAYIAAFFFRLFGVSMFSLLLGLTLIYAGFLAAIYRLTTLLYSRGLALLTLILLSLGSNPMFSRELVAIGGYPETLLFGVMVLLLASWLVLTGVQDAAMRSRREQRWRLAAYVGWGFMSGLGIWTHLLTLPFILLSGLLLVLFCWQELRWRTLICLLVALLLGLLPMLIYNVIALIFSPGNDTLSYLLRVHGAAGITIPSGLPPILRQFWGALLISLPTMTGATPLCAPSQIDLLRLNDSTVLGCTTVHAGWSLGMVVLWVWSLVISLSMLWRSRQLWWGKTRQISSLEERTGLAVHTARLMLLGTGGLTFLLYVISPDAMLFPVATSRYLVGLLVSLPAVLWPLWSGASAAWPLVLSSLVHKPASLGSARPGMIGRYSVLLFVGAIYLLGTLSIFTSFPPSPQVEQPWGPFALQVNDRHLDLTTVRALNDRQYSLIHHLQSMRVKYIYSDYWTCNRIIFQSQEHIICAVLDLNKGTKLLEIGQNRYLPYLREVLADPHATYIFGLGSPEAQSFERMRLENLYRRQTFDGYVLYQLRL